MGNSILLCTVGGSHQPILKAIESLDPAYICFFYSGRDPVTEKLGSLIQITGSGNVIKENRCDKKPTLPNIPSQAGLDESRFESVEIPADNLDQAFVIIHQTIERLKSCFPHKRFVADYTGGTKTMTIALVCAALESDNIQFQIVTGARIDLDQVKDGTEFAMSTSVEKLRLKRTVEPYLGAWNRFAYREAAAGLARIQIAVNSQERKRLALARAFSESLAHWDDFDHRRARSKAEPFRRDFIRTYPWMLPTLDMFDNKKSSQQEPALLYDLWLNAERRATQGRFDDAVARVYRLIEWTAQWQLRTKLQLNTAAFPIDRLPKGQEARPGPNGNVQIGLMPAWAVIGENLQDHVRDFWVGQRNKMRDLIQIRNHSILAHGFESIQEADWKRFKDWIEDHFLPMFSLEAAKVGLKKLPPQLPNIPPSIVNFLEA